LFKFVNSYNSFFYIAFLKRYDSTANSALPECNTVPPASHCSNGCPAGDETCLQLLRTQLVIVMVTALSVNNLIKLLVPKIQTWLAEREDRDVQVKKSSAEKEFDLAPYTTTFDDFDLLALQFGYVTLFTIALPLMPLIALISNMVQARVDAAHVTLLCRRPIPRGQYGIGTWYGIFNSVSYLAVFTNVGLVCFETNRMRSWFPNPLDRLWIAILAEHVILIAKIALSQFVPDEPKDVENRRLRQEFIVDILLRGAEIEQTDDTSTKADEKKVVESKSSMTLRDASALTRRFNWETLPKEMPKDPDHEHPGVRDEE